MYLGIYTIVYQRFSEGMLRKIFEYTIVIVYSIQYYYYSMYEKATSSYIILHYLHISIYRIHALFTCILCTQHVCLFTHVTSIGQPTLACDSF